MDDTFCGIANFKPRHSTSFSKKDSFYEEMFVICLSTSDFLWRSLAIFFACLFAIKLKLLLTEIVDCIQNAEITKRRALLRYFGIDLTELLLKCVGKMRKRKITFEKELDHKISFLDVLVDNSLATPVTTVFRKNTYTGLFTNFFSCKIGLKSEHF